MDSKRRDIGLSIQFFSEVPFSALREVRELAIPLPEFQGFSELTEEERRPVANNDNGPRG